MMYSDLYNTLAGLVKTATLSVLFSTILLYILQIRSIFTRNKWKLLGKRLPPGPKPWPLVGNLPSIATDPVGGLVNLARIYGPVMSFQLGTRPAVVFSSATMAREIFKTHDKCFGQHASSVAIEASAEERAPVFFNNGDEWKSLKKMFTADLLTKRQLELAEAGRTEEVLLALRALVESTEKSRLAGEEVCEVLSQYFFQVGGNVISRAICDERLLTTSYSDFKSNDFTQALKQATDLIIAFDFRDAFPFLKHLDVQGKSKRLRAVKHKLRNILRVLVDARKEELQKGSRRNDDEDLLDVLFSFESKGGSMSDYLKTELMTVLMIATATPTGNVVDWAISELLRKPKFLKKCQEQLDTVVGSDRLVAESDLANLPFVRAILLESMRLHPLSAFMAPRQSAWDCEVGGYFIPANTIALFNVRAINRDPDTWSNPHEFNPDRHFKSPDEDVDINAEDFTLLHFGAGRRSCPGRGLGWRILQLILATFLHSSDFKLAAGLRPEQLNMSGKLRLDGPRVEPLKLIPTLRIPRSVIFN